MRPVDDAGIASALMLVLQERAAVIGLVAGAAAGPIDLSQQTASICGCRCNPQLLAEIAHGPQCQHRLTLKRSMEMSSSEMMRWQKWTAVLSVAKMAGQEQPGAHMLGRR